MQGQNWLPAPPQFPVGPPSVLGLPLEPGERVIWFKKHEYGAAKVGYIILGVLLIPILIGIWFIYYGATLEKRRPRAHALTTHRFIVFAPEGPPQMYPLAYAVDVEPKRQDVHAGGGGLLGAAISMAATAVVNSMADKRGKIDPKYWARTIGVTIVMHDGGRPFIELSQDDGATVGMLLARAILGREAHYMPPMGSYLP